jgi:isoquinoline 1-oxidoreductase beta subunit
MAPAILFSFSFFYRERVMALHKPTRRGLLIGACASGALVAGFALVPRRYGSPLVAARGQHVVDSYLKLACDGTLSVAVPACEMGQG